MEYFSGYHIGMVDEFFSEEARVSGMEYCYDQAVVYQGVHDTVSEFSILKNGKPKYQVQLIVDEEGSTASSLCSCRAGKFCRHIYAALLEAVQNELPVSREMKGSGLLDGSARLHSQIYHLMRLPYPRTPNRQGRYVPVFFIESEGSTGKNHRITIRPCMRYVKKNGELGAFSEFKNGSDIGEHTPQESYLISVCLQYENRRTDILGMLNMLRANPDLRLYTGDLQEPVPLKVLRPERAVVEFEPALNPSEEKSVGFMPVLAVDGHRIHIFESTVWLAGSPCMLLSEDSGFLVELPLSDMQDIYAFNFFAGFEHLYSKAEIDAIRAYVSNGALDVQPAPEDIELEFITSTPWLLLEELSEGTGLMAGSVGGAGKQSIHREESGKWKIQICDEGIDPTEVFKRLKAVPRWEGTAMVPVPLHSFLADWGYTLLSEGWEIRVGFDRIPVKKAQAIHIETRSGTDWLELRTRMENKEIDLRGFDHGMRLLIQDEQYIVLDKEGMEKLTRLSAAPLDSRGNVRIHPNDVGSIAHLGSIIDDLDDARIERAKNIIARLKERAETWDTSGTSAAPAANAEQADEQTQVSPAFKGQLRDYQKQGLRWLRFLKDFGLGGVLADDMGLGKTVQSIALMADAFQQDPSSAFLVTAPLSTIPNWTSEISRFLPEIHTKIHIGTKRKPLSGNAPGVTITSYQTMQRDIEDIETVEWDLVFLDESQFVKNHRTAGHKAVRRLKTRQLVALSGTPMENNVMELWSVMDLLNPGLLGSREDFRKRFLKPIERGKQQPAEELKRRIAPFILRRTKNRVAEELPPREEIVKMVGLSDAEKRFYAGLKSGLRDRVQSIILQGLKDFSAANAVIMALLKLRQAAISPALIGEKPQTSSKLDEAAELLKKVIAEGHKVLIFSQFVKVLAMMKQRLDDSDISYAYLDGSLNSRQRESAIASFREQQAVFLISLKAGGTGLNLTEADYIFILDPWWNPAVEAQAIDRSHRIGQTRPVIAYRFIAADTVEERILELQEKKRRLADQIIGGDQSAESAALRSLNPQEILRLFS